MATGICYTWSGPKKRYEDKVSISLEKGNYDLPAIKNDVLSVANENHYSFEVSSHYKLHSKGNYSGDMPLVFVTYYPDSGKTPCYFNFDYNYIDIEIQLLFLWPGYVKFNSSSINLTIHINSISGRITKKITKKSDLKFKIIKGSSISIDTLGINNIGLGMYIKNYESENLDYQYIYNGQDKTILSDTYYSNITESCTIQIKFTNRVIYMIPLYDTNSGGGWLDSNWPIRPDNKLQCYTTDAVNNSNYTLISNDEEYAYATIMFHHVYKADRIGAFMGTIVLPSLEKPTKIIDYDKVKNNYKGYEFKRNNNVGVLWGAAKLVKTTDDKPTYSGPNETLNDKDTPKKDPVSVLNWPDGFPKKYLTDNHSEIIIKNKYDGGFTQYNQVLINGMFYDHNYNNTLINYKYRKVGTVHFVSEWKGNSCIICDNSISSNESFKKNMPYNGVLLGMKQWYNDTIASGGNISFGGINAIYTGEFMSLLQEGKIGDKHNTFLNWIDPSKENANNFAGYFMIGRYYRSGYCLCGIGARFAVYPEICKKDVIDLWHSYDIFITDGIG